MLFTLPQNVLSGFQSGARDPATDQLTTDTAQLPIATFSLEELVEPLPGGNLLPEPGKGLPGEPVAEPIPGFVAAAGQEAPPITPPMVAATKWGFASDWASYHPESTDVTGRTQTTAISEPDPLSAPTDVTAAGKGARPERQQLAPAPAIEPAVRTKLGEASFAWLDNADKVDAGRALSLTAELRPPGVMLATPTATARTAELPPTANAAPASRAGRIRIAVPAGMPESLQSASPVPQTAPTLPPAAKSSADAQTVASPQTGVNATALVGSSRPVVNAPPEGKRQTVVNTPPPKSPPPALAASVDHILFDRERDAGPVGLRSTAQAAAPVAKNDSAPERLVAGGNIATRAEAAAIRGPAHGNNITPVSAEGRGNEQPTTVVREPRPTQAQITTTTETTQPASPESRRPLEPAAAIALRNDTVPIRVTEPGNRTVTAQRSVSVAVDQTTKPLVRNEVSPTTPQPELAAAATTLRPSSAASTPAAVDAERLSPAATDNSPAASLTVRAVAASSPANGGDASSQSDIQPGERFAPTARQPVAAAQPPETSRPSVAQEPSVNAAAARTPLATRTPAVEQVERDTRLRRAGNADVGARVVDKAAVDGEAPLEPALRPTTATGGVRPMTATTMSPLTTALAMDAPDFAEQLSERLTAQLARGIGRLEIQINPRHLGPISVELQQAGDAVHVQVSASQTATRDLLEQALPRLREQLDSAEVSLGRTADDGAASGGSRHAGRALQTAYNTPAGDNAEADTTGEPAHVVRPEVPLGVIDTYV